MESSNDSGAGGFAGSINDLAKTVPEVLGDANAQKAAAKPEVAKPTVSKSSGLLGQGLTLYSEIRTVHQIDQMANETEQVREIAAALRQPMRDALGSIVQRGRNLAGQTPPSDPAQAKAAQQELRTLTDQFKQLANVVIPLSQELVVLDQSRSNFINWRNSLARESKDTLRSVVLSALGIFLALGALWVLSEVWRRWTFRYIHDLRRRRQFQLLRRFVMGFLIAVVFTLGVVSDFSSLATFAGFATAGIAVGLQAVLLSVAAYFFVIGRYGIRIGDRISVAGVTGDVIDVSPVRFYLMELAGSDVNLFPTGRIVVFSNSVLFQATTPLYKQIPGTDYTWHEVALQCVPGADYKLLEEKLLAAVNSIYDRYRPDIERQHNQLERLIEIQVKAPAPQAKLHFGGYRSGVYSPLSDGDSHRAGYRPAGHRSGLGDNRERTKSKGCCDGFAENSSIDKNLAEVRLSDATPPWLFSRAARTPRSLKERSASNSPAAPSPLPIRARRTSKPVLHWAGAGICHI